MTGAKSIRVGVAGWSYEDWKGIVYPHYPPRGFDPLVYVARYVDVIEINTTFYRTPTLSMVRRWAHRVSRIDTLDFTVKVPGALTHHGGGRTIAQAFLASMEPLADRIGAWLLQFPFHFADAPASRDRLQELIEPYVDRGFTVCELRCRSWFRPDARAFLKALGIQVASLDMPGSGPDGEQVLLGFAGAPYVRWHGRNRAAWFRKDADRDSKYDHLYPHAVVERWVKHVERATSPGQIAYVIANNHFRGQALVNASQARAILRGERVPVPRSLLERYPSSQGCLFPDPAEDGGQPRLF